METDLNVEEIRGAISKQIFTTSTDSADNYNDEWITIGCIEESFKEIQKVQETIETSKAILVGHLDELDAIKQEVISRLSTISNYLKSFTKKTATVNASSLNVRSGKGTNNSIIGGVSQGQEIEVIEQDDGSGWTKVKIGDQEGYVSTKYISTDTSKPSNKSDDGSSGIEPSLSSDVDSVKDEIKDKPKDKPESKPTSSGDIPTVGISDKLNENQNAIVTADSLKIRKGAGTNSDVLGYVSKGDNLEILESDKGSGWTKIKIGDQEGYVSTKYISIENNGDK